jgi:predicted ATP-grasp superfamily ATP-dependent carboligase
LKTGHYPVHHGGLGIVRSLGMLGIPIYTIIEDRFAPAAVSRHLTGRFVWDTRGLTRPQLLEGLALIGTTMKRRAILIPTDDFAAILIAEENTVLRQWFVFPETRSDVPRSLANKMLLHALCTELKVPTPLTLAPKSVPEVHAFIESTTFPVVAKASAGWLTSASKTKLVYSLSELLAIYRDAEREEPGNLVIQEYIADGEDWFFHGYCNAKSECLAGFTGRKIRSFPPRAGITTLGRSVRNEALSRQSDGLLKAIPYAGIMDIDYRLDRRDGQYKLLDFNPRIGAQFRLFEDSEGLDVARVLYRDLTGQSVRRSQQIDGTLFIVEPDDCRASFYHFRRRELSVLDWWQSLKGPKEFAWFRWKDPLPFLMVWIHLVFSRASRLANLLRSRLLHSPTWSQHPERHRDIVFRVLRK